MGLKDEDYANALEHQRLHQVALMKLELLKMKEEAKMARTGVVVNNTNTITSIGTNTTTGTWGSTGVTLNNIAHPIGLKVITEENLNHDAMKAPLSALVDMWTMRWQGNWVNEAEFDEDDFWRLALVRLLGASKLEKHNLADQHRPVYRIIE